eukprot:3761716-Alexandrium_andersonii.AAC.1
MAVLSLLTRALIDFVTVHHGSTGIRLLADDALLQTGVQSPLSEDEAHEAHRAAVTDAVRLLQAMGARIAADKSATLASTARLRARWRGLVICGLGQAMPVKTHMRDLGARMNLGQIACSGTIKKRLLEGIRTL